MPTKGDTQVNNFVAGLITESSPLNFPPNASKDEINFKLLRDGTRERRLGLDFEDGYTLHDTGFTTAQMQQSRQTFFHWPKPSGSTKVSIGIIQIGGALYFIDLWKEAPSSNLLNSGNAVDSGLRGNVNLSFSIINNNVVVVSEALPTPFVLSYDDSTDTVTATSQTIQIRDLYGVDDSLEAGERPATLSNNHKYNLRNQGWDANIVSTCGTDAIDCTHANIGVYPSNSDTWSLGKIADVTSADIDKYDPETLKRNSVDIGRAPRGHYIIDLYDRGASRLDVSGITVSSTDREEGLVSTSATYAGRIFYSGINSNVLGGDKFSPNLSGAVLFSQVVLNDEDIGKCYQEGDPTSPTNSDLVDTDGGIIIITGAINISKIKPIKSSLFVFAENGVWEIRGSNGGFTATEFQVNKISSIGVFSPESIVEANGVVFFWGENGIFSLTPNQFDSTIYDTTNITLQTIQKGYNSLPNLIKQTAKGFYDASNNTIRWLYKSDFAKVQGEPIDIQPVVPVTEIGTPTEAATDRQQPLFAKVSDTKVFMLYRNTSVNQMYYKIITIDPDTLALTYGAETTVKASSVITSMAVVGYKEDKVLLVYRDVASGTTTNAMVGTVSGDVTTFGTPVALGTVFAGDLARGLFELKKISETRCLFGATNTVNAKPTLQVIDISASDVITFGTPVTATSINTATLKLAIFSPTSGMIANGGSSVNVAATTEHFTISGTTPVFNGTVYTFTNNTQFPPPISDQFFIGDLVETSTSTAILYGAGVVDSANGDISMQITNTSGVLTSTAALSESNSLSGPTNHRSSIEHIGSRIVSVALDRTHTPNRINFAIHTKVNPPVLVTRSILESATSMDHPNSVILTDQIVIQGYTSNPGTPGIKAVAHRIV